MKLETERYLHHLEGLDLSVEQKEEIIRSVQGLMESCVDKAFGLHPVQKICGRNDINNLRKAVKALDSKGAPVLYCFGKAANDDHCERDTERKKHG